MVKIIKNPENPQPDEVIAQSIIELSEGMRKLNLGPLKKETLIVLLHNSTKLPKREIEYVLNALSRLEADYLKPKK